MIFDNSQIFVLAGFLIIIMLLMNLVRIKTNKIDDTRKLVNDMIHDVDNEMLGTRPNDNERIFTRQDLNARIIIKLDRIIEEIKK